MKTIKVGVIGVAGRGATFVEHMNDPEGRSRVVAGMDVSDNAIDMFKKKMPDAYATKSVADLLSRDIDAVVVASPDHMHAEQVTAAFAAGKHVYSEKPLGITIEQCDGMLEAWQKSGRQFMVGFNMRYMNIFRAMKDIADSGAIGELKAVWVRHFVGYGGDWYYHDWHADKKNSTGLLLQKASHDIDMIHWITGKYTKRVVGMGAQMYYGGDKPNDLRCPACAEKDTCVEYHYRDKGGNTMDQCVFRKESNVEDVSTVMMELDGGIQAMYTQCHFTPDYFRNYVFIGTEGRMENLDDHSKVVVKYRKRSKRGKNITSDEVHDIRPAEGGHGGADPVICRDFIDMILDGKKPISTPLAGRMSVAVGVKATESLRGKSMPLDIPALPASIAGKVY
ncbi:MAG: Gfo/Idh/MocA family oxidoreductase [Spirochaetota bacterium]